MSPTEKPRLLVIDDNDDLSSLVREVGAGLGYQSRAACGWEEIQSAVEEFHPDVIVLDVLMPDMDGIEVVQYLTGRQTRACLVVLSGADGGLRQVTSHLAKATGLNLLGTLQKPASIDELEDLLKRALDPETRAAVPPR